MSQYWWVVAVALALLALVAVWIALARRPGVGADAAASLRDLDGQQAARPTFARQTALETPPEPISTQLGDRARAPAEPIVEPGFVDAATSQGIGPAAVTSPAQPVADDLTRMKGFGPKLRDRLAELGVTRFHQIAAWSDADVERIDAQLDRFQGRIRRDDWIEQARFLASDDRSGYENRFGALG